jgi:hypothetical protein
LEAGPGADRLGVSQGGTAVISKQGARRRRTAVAALSVVALGVAGIVAANIQPAAATTTYSQYTLWGENSVHVGFETSITGMVGARHDRPKGPNASRALTMAGGGTVINGDVRIGDNSAPLGNVQIGNMAKINGTLYYANNMTKTPTGYVQNAVHGPADLPSGPIPTLWPAPGPSATCAQGGEQFPEGTTDFELTAGHQYGAIHAGRSKITFNGAGDYFIDSVSVSTITFKYNIGNGNIRVFVCQGVEGATILGPPPAQNANHIYWEVNGTPPGTGTTGNIFEFSNGPWVGDVVAPNGGIHYGSGGSGSASMSGHFWAEHIDLEHGLHVSSPPPEPPTTTTSSSSSSSSTSSTSTSSTSTSSTSTSSTSSTSTSSTSTSSTSTSSTSTSSTTSTTIRF